MMQLQGRDTGGTPLLVQGEVQLPRAEPRMEQHTVETALRQCLAGGSQVDFGVFECRPLHDPVGRQPRAEAAE